MDGLRFFFCKSLFRWTLHARIRIRDGVYMSDKLMGILCILQNSTWRCVWYCESTTRKTRIHVSVRCTHIVRWNVCINECDHFSIHTSTRILFEVYETNILLNMNERTTLHSLVRANEFISWNPVQWALGWAHTGSVIRLEAETANTLCTLNVLQDLCMK